MRKKYLPGLEFGEMVGIPSGVGFWRNEYFPELEFGEMNLTEWNGSIGTISKGAVRIRPDKSFYDEIGGNFGKKI
ncbi:unnamed protein product [Rhizophagus irregularis]|uniref:Uncharacterized protein n=1 Tax=Rhizophagus irregularis TaxID=588596 RepID=A0A915Z768_9GLOM|nr:unnamed protein product [Rhizophagus irregularis]